MDITIKQNTTKHMETGTKEEKYEKEKTVVGQSFLQRPKRKKYVHNSF